MDEEVTGTWLDDMERRWLEWVAGENEMIIFGDGDSGNVAGWGPGPRVQRIERRFH
jgi:hypothetical protein